MTERETYDQYLVRKAEWQKRYNEWKSNGKVGDPPPYPVMPHTPGFNPMAHTDRDTR